MVRCSWDEASYCVARYGENVEYLEQLTTITIAMPSGTRPRPVSRQTVLSRSTVRQRRGFRDGKVLSRESALRSSI